MVQDPRIKIRKIEQANDKATIELSKVQLLVIITLVVDFELGDVRIFVMDEVQQSYGGDNEDEGFLGQCKSTAYQSIELCLTPVVD